MFWFCLLAFLGQQRWPIQTLSVEGNRIYSTERILNVAGLKTGQLAGKDEFEAARDRLVRTGAFESVGYRFAPGPDKKGYAASFQVVEVEPVYPLRFEDLELPDSDVLARLRAREPLLEDRMPATAPVVQRYVEEIEALLAERRRLEKVSGRVVATGPDRFALLFRPARPVPTVAQVTFTGNQVVPAAALLNAVSGVAVGVPYTEERFRELLDTSVRPLYEARGRIRAAWTKIAVEPAKDVAGLNVTVNIDEGASYDLGKVTLTGTAPLKPDELLKAGKFTSGDLANFDLVNQGVDRIREIYGNNGFLKVQTELVRKVDDAAKTVDVNVRVQPGPQFVMGKLAIRGLDIHGEAAIRKMWGLKEGRPFRAGYPDHFLNRVREDGLFDNLKKTKSAVQVNEAANTVDVTLTFN